VPPADCVRPYTLCDPCQKPAIVQRREPSTISPVESFYAFTLNQNGTHMTQQIQTSRSNGNDTNQNIAGRVGGLGKGLVIVAAAASLGACAEDAAQFAARHAGTPADEAEAVAGLSASLTALLTEHGLTAAPAGQAPDLILRCLVTDARSGSRFKRMVVGLGAGKARLQLQVSLIDPRINQQPVLSFETASTTGSSPGAAIPVGPGGAIGAVGGAYGFYKGTKAGLPAEEAQTEKKIDGQLKIYFTAQGWKYLDPVKAG
jgi:hypothetical protein